MSDSRLINRNVVARRGRTSMRLEPELWQALAEISERERKDVNLLVRNAEGEDNPGGRTSAVRVFVLDYFRSAASECGHAAAGHGTRTPPRCEVEMSAEQPVPSQTSTGILAEAVLDFA